MEKTDSVTGEGTERGNMLQEIRERLREESQNQSAYFPRNPYWEPTKEEMANEMREIDARVTGEGNAPRTVRIIWSTSSGTGSTEFTYLCKDYSEALAKARKEFRVFFSGYTLTATSIA